MLITEVGKDSLLTVNASKGLQTVSFETSIVKQIEDTILLEPMYHEKELVSFISDFVRVDIVLHTEGENPILFQNVEIIACYFDKKRYHALRVNYEGKVMNRRKAIRMFVGIQGTVMFGDNHMPVDCTIKDVSMTGFSFFCSKSIPDNVIGKCMVKIMFKDENLQRRMSIDGIVVRCLKEEGNGRILYGCHLHKHDSKVGEYVVALQRIKMQRVTSKKN